VVQLHLTVCFIPVQRSCPVQTHFFSFCTVQELRSHIYHDEYRCDERLRSKTEGSTRLSYTGLRGGLEHPKIEMEDV
jgi:hypothetical protein